MALVVYPTTLPIPDIALSGDTILPLAESNLNEIGKFETYRRMTRAYYRVSSGYLLESADVPVFLDFFNNTLNAGMKYFLADWIDLIGIKGYKAKIVGFELGLQGIKVRSSIQFEFCPYLQYSSVNPLIPSPWPNKSDA